MTERRNDNAAFAELAARRRAERADKLARAKREAAERGKQPFDLDTLEQLYDTHSPGGFQQPRDERELDYEYRYYATYPETMNLAEYAAKQQAHDAGADPRPPSGAAELAARANTLLSRVPAELDALTRVGADQARPDLGEAVQHLEASLSLTGGSDPPAR